MKLITIIIMVVFIPFVSHSQISEILGLNLTKEQKELNKKYSKARNLYETGHFEESRDLYLELIKKVPNDFNYNYELGLLYFYELNQKAKSIQYFESAKKIMKDTVIDLYNYLGQAYQKNRQYDKAIDNFNIYSSIPPKVGVIRVSVKRYIRDCLKEKRKLQEIENKRNSIGEDGIQIINAGPIVNSEQDDISPLVYNNKLLYSTSKKFDYVFNEYIYHPYISEILSKEYGSPVFLGNVTNDKGMIIDPDWHQVITSITEDGKLIVSIYEKNIWVTKKLGKNWGEPKKMSREINSSKDNAYATLSIKGDRMIICRYNKKNKSYDLYQTVKDGNETWKTPVPMNNKINTVANEHYPSLSEDGYTLYFSSDRKGGMGKYDIYKSQLQENNQWGDPVLLEAPINSKYNDICFIKYKSKNKGYFSSDRKDGFGKYDIYEINY